ncbi:MAG: Fis family transcriptional regulator [Myxococcaceae bacterium]|nr:Fis family transcriptional regulator [Myxococcaceae bacterium]
MTLLKLPTVDPTVTSSRAKALVFEDARSKELLRLIERIAPSQATVLVTGETGTGKEIVARHLHELSARREGPFLAINCGAFSETLVESELFGHEKGSFTGATSTRAGWFEAAEGGTLFLDEIGDLPAPVQVKLLRVLQEREIVRLGSRQAQPIDVRLIAATNVDLAEAVAAGRFREDLFYRLNVASIALPALRERAGDILPLARYFLELYRSRLGLGSVRLSGRAERDLLEHPWPGNIRELDNVVHRALLVFHGDEISSSDLRLSPLPKARSVRPDARADDALERALVALFEQGGPEVYNHIEERLMRAAYHFCDRNQVQTAKLLGVSRNIVRARLIQYGDIASAPRQAGIPRPSAVPERGAQLGAR